MDIDNWSDEGGICPYCGELYDASDSEGYLYQEEDSEIEVMCQECGREYIVTPSVSYAWTSHRMDCHKIKEKHKWGEWRVVGTSLFRNCMKCDKYEIKRNKIKSD